MALRYPIVIIGGFLVDWTAYRPLAQQLETICRAPVAIVPLTQASWLYASGVGSYRNLLDMAQATVEKTRQAHAAKRVNLVTHSAGGIVARLYLGDDAYDGVAYRGHRQTATLVTLGCPHASLLSWTRRTMDFVNSHYPGAFYASVRYVAVIGCAIRGAFPGTLAEMAAYQSYRLVCGDGTVWGDGVVPVASGQLEGAVNYVCDGIQHVPNRPGADWYDRAVEQWRPHLQ
ncbi:MAG: lipase [Chloracidobacterium sp.]|uniref:Lipase n=1 Tax=Chloracidobacterium validum TaxID=2821543 RepID=A0ABX8B7K8_9BACT|nr:lipase [Chloracidobacterium validum]QUW02898.1 lipase [Chloracidobacterium validum]